MEELPPENGRATVALVDAKVDGLKDLIRAEFKDVQRQLENFGQLAAKVEGHGDRLLMVEGRVSSVERRMENKDITERRRKNYRTIHLPSLVIALISALGFVLSLVIHH